MKPAIINLSHSEESGTAERKFEELVKWQWFEKEELKTRERLARVMEDKPGMSKNI